MSPREKALDRVAKFLALADSPNKNEAEGAAQRAHALIAKHGFTRDEIDERMAVATREDAGELGDDATWRKQLAVFVAARWRCTALASSSRLLFGGKHAKRCVAQYRIVSESLRAACEQCCGSYGNPREFHRPWQSIFLAAAVDEIARRLMVAPLAEGVAEDERRPLRVSDAQFKEIERDLSQLRGWLQSQSYGMSWAWSFHADAATRDGRKCGRSLDIEGVPLAVDASRILTGR